jgi:hypothetical protein
MRVSLNLNARFGMLNTRFGERQRTLWPGGVFQSTRDEVPAKVTAEATSVGSSRLPVLRVT